MRHPAETVYYVVSGTGSVLDLSDKRTEEIGEGSFVFLGAGTSNRFETSDRIEIVDGPCPPDESLYMDKEASDT